MGPSLQKAALFFPRRRLLFPERVTLFGDIETRFLMVFYLRPTHLPLMFYSGPGLIPGSWIMMRHVSCILLLEWSTTSQRLWVCRISVPYVQKDPRFIFEKRRGQPQEFWSLTIDGSTLPKDCVEDRLCGTQRNW